MACVLQAKEAELFMKLLVSPEARALQHVFFSERAGAELVCSTRTRAREGGGGARAPLLIRVSTRHERMPVVGSVVCFAVWQLMRSVSAHGLAA